jgi:hypothetical protein
VFLKPLMEDMKMLRDGEVKMMDSSVKKEFTLKSQSLSPSPITLAFSHCPGRSKASPVV